MGKAETGMNANDFMLLFFKMEAENNLLVKEIDGIAWWDVSRHAIYYKLFYNLISITRPSSSKIRLKKIWAKGYLLLKKILKPYILRIKICLFSYDFIAFRCPRDTIDSRPFDKIMDPILEQLNDSGLIINTYPYAHYLSPRFLRKKKPVPLESFDNINSIVLKYFGVRLDIASLIADEMSLFFHNQRLYTKMFSRIKPKLILLVQNGIQKSLFHAASLLNTPVIELQHGLICFSHPAYSYPINFVSKSPSLFPDYFLTFSGYWIAQCHYPSKVIAVGNDAHYYEKASCHAEQAVLFVSADIYHERLAAIIRSLAKKHPLQQFIYKLHPNQYHSFKDISREFHLFHNIQVLLDELTLRQLIYASHTVALIQSTAVYEALQAGRYVILFAECDYTVHEDVFNNPNVRVISDIEEIDIVFKATHVDERPAPSLFFEKMNQKKIGNILAQFLG